MSKTRPKKRAPAKKTGPKKRPAKKAPARKGGRPPTDPAKIAAALAEVGRGTSVAEAARKVGIHHATLYRAIKERGGPAPGPAAAPPPPAPPSGDGDELPEIDPDASALDTARILLEHMKETIRRLPKDSPRLNPAHANVRAYLKLVAALEREQAGDETPEQAAERKRREDGETRRAIERYVLEYEAQAQRDGVCLHCGAPRDWRERMPVEEGASE